VAAGATQPRLEDRIHRQDRSAGDPIEATCSCLHRLGPSIRTSRVRPAAALSLLAAAALAAGCGRSGDGRPDDELGGLVVDRGTAGARIDVDRAAKDAGELARALALGHDQVGVLIGPHAMAGKSHMEVREGSTPVEVLDDETAIQLDGKGNYHAVLSNSKEYGREVFFVDGTMYLRPRYGKYHKRPPADEAEPARLRGEIFSTVAAHFDLLAGGVSVSDGGKTEVHGRPARKVVIATGKEKVKRSESLSQRKWRESAVVMEVAGEIALDEKTGAPLRATLRGTVAFQRDGRSFEMRLESSHELSAFGSVPPVVAPSDEETVADIGQRHELAERDALLQGIAPPARKAPVPGAVTPAPAADK